MRILRALFHSLAMITLLAVISSSDETRDVMFDFEDGSLQGWQVVEGQFDKILNDIEYFHNQPDVDYNKEGRYYLNTLEKSDGSRTDQFVGVLESPVFVLHNPKMSFLVGGGKHSDTYVALCDLDGNELRKAQGKIVNGWSESSGTFLPWLVSLVSFGL